MTRMARPGQSMGALALCLLAATGANAGAWPREEGTIFLAVGSNVALTEAAQRPVHYDPTLYLEYGLTGNLTIGLDGYLSDAGQAGSGFVFARYPLRFGPVGDPDGPSRLAASLGLGATIMPDDEVEPSLRLGLSYGYGLSTGWLSVDADVVQSLGSDRRQSKLAVTWGHELTEDWTAILEAQIGTGLTGDFYAKITPSVAWEYSDRLTIRMGATRALTGDRGMGLMVQTWWTF